MQNITSRYGMERNEMTTLACRDSNNVLYVTYVCVCVRVCMCGYKVNGGCLRDGSFIYYQRNGNDIVFKKSTERT